MKYGYARVSTQDQELGRQIAELEKSGCGMIFTDKITGMSTTRPEFDKMLQVLKPGDSVIVHKLDRLGRNSIHLQELIRDLSARGIKFISLTEGFDYSTPMGKAMFTIISALAEMERDVIKERIVHGIAHAKKNGTKSGKPFGRPWKDMSGPILEQYKRGVSVTDIATKLSISRSRVYSAIERATEQAEQAN